VERIVQWLQAEPQCNAKTLLGRLIELNPQRYGEHHLRTLQRRLRGYRLQWSRSSGRWPLRQQPQAQGCTGTEPRRRLRWSGFSGQPPSLTSEAGHRP
jgi:hypothetical protein